MRLLSSPISHISTKRSEAEQNGQQQYGAKKKERRNNLVYIYLAEINYIHQSHEKWQCPHFYYPAYIHIHSSRLTRATHTKYRIMYWKSVEGKMLVYSNSVEHYRNT